MTEDDRLSAAAILAEMERQVRDQAAGVPPEFCEPVALSSAETLLAACQMLVYRELDAKLPEIVLSDQRPGKKSASDHYSVDVVLRFLPDVFRLASAAAKDDPLIVPLVDVFRKTDTLFASWFDTAISGLPSWSRSHAESVCPQSSSSACTARLSAAVITMFNVVDRVADATGIPIDEGFTRDVRYAVGAELGMSHLAPEERARS